MASPTDFSTKTIRLAWQQPRARRWLLLTIAAGALLVMGFYTVTDSAHLAHSGVLDGADWLGYAVCHRITERSFTIAGRQLPLCARCTGMYLGFMATVLVLVLNGRWRWGELPPLPVLLVLLGFVGLMGVDGLNSYAHFFPDAPHIYEPRNWLRLVTGMGTGLAMGGILLPALAQTLWREQVYLPAVGSLRELAGLILVAGTAVLLVLSNQPTILYVLALVSAGGLLFCLAGINLIILLVLSRRDGQVERWRDMVAPVAVGVTLAVVELSAISLVRLSLTGTMTGFPGL